MGKKITLTLFNNNPIEIDVDDICAIGPKGAYIVLKDGKAYLIKESKSRILKMIETAK